MQELDPLLHNQLRLAIISLLVANKQVSFSYIVDQTGATRGNVSAQITRLEEAGYVSVHKQFKSKKPLTSLTITTKGLDAMEQYTRALKDYLKL